jgi:LacI family transcriptional regulator
VTTIRDVAKRAGVSVATVSRVMNGSGPVSAAAAKRIHDAASSLRYVPHIGARSLITAKTHTLGVLLPDLYGEFFSELIRGIQETAQGHGYHLLFASARGGKSEIRAAIRAMRGRVDGLVIMSPHADADTLVENFPTSVPIALLSCGVKEARYPVIDIDNGKGARDVMKHLVSLGHRRIAHITGASGNVDAAERLKGFRAGIKAAGLVRGECPELDGDFTEASGYRAGEQLLRLTPRPTAVFAANDAMALGVMGALRERRMRVPEDISVVGFDDIPVARYVHPTLTSVHVPIAEMGQRAASILIGALTTALPAEARLERLATRLVVRGSSAPPPTSNRRRST